MEFISKGYSRIFVENEDAVKFVKEWFKNDDEFESEYLGKETVEIVDNLDDPDLSFHLTYNGKFEGNLKGLLSAASDVGIKIVVMVSYPDSEGHYYVHDVVTYASFIYTNKTGAPSKKEVVDTIINNVDIRGIDLEAYERHFGDCYEALLDLFKKK